MLTVAYIALGYLLITSAVLLMNRRDFKPLESVPPSYFARQAPSASICIPARNEEASVERCVRSAVSQQYPDFQVYVLDDGSTDATGTILARLKDQFPNRLTVLRGRPKPDGWLGKPWACHQLAEASREEILLFIDADTWLEPSALSKTVRTMGQDVLDFITLWPSQELGTFWEKNVIPLIYMALLTLLPVRYVRRAPRWIPPFLRKTVAPLFAAACGQFMAFKRESYEQVGGHRSVKDEIVEDVALAKNIKRSGLAMNMYHGSRVVSCRMYRTAQELWQGLRKNFLAGFSHHIPSFMFMALLHAVVFLLPVLSIPLLYDRDQLLLLFSAAVLLMLLQRMIINRWFDWPMYYALLHPLGVGWFQLLGIQVLRDHLSREAPEWKGRPL
ncbi:glycosyltransferase [Fodinibius sediminis]|uniref:Chlorobactene glucosyltransferase n=1 Tax=Fodinibius sediminis TaxID=1214077 RepID=A0A521E2X2_9BACT|nr:glycosyltransferase family 2 protein [Fodinibius sediminis]SMO78307.1 chlorobactene glucosyltransferase [Fodinibius sediminis]